VEYLVGALAAALLISAAGLVVQHFMNKRVVALLVLRETRALDTARAAELRSAQQIDALLDRVSTAPRIELSRAELTPEPDSSTRRYIADHVADDAAWNEYRGESDEVAE
jgi:hypothetical protein